MSEHARNSWQCPACGRQIPRHVEVCRCGSERKRLEALGYKFESAPASPKRLASKRRAPSPGLAGALVGYQLDTDLDARAWIAFRALFAIAVIGVAVSLAFFTHSEPVPNRGNVQILNTLDNFTREAGPGSGNTIPSFIASAGRLGVLAATGEPGDPVRGIREFQLREGFCSQSVASQVRHEYPGFYEKWPDDKLERTFLEKYPEYADRVCVLSVRFDATGSDIIKYEVKRSALLAHATFLWLRTLLLTTMFAVACLNVYYRLIVRRVVPLLDAAA